MSAKRKIVIFTRDNMGATQYKYVDKLKAEYLQNLSPQQRGGFEFEEYNLSEYTNPLHFIQGMFTVDVDLHIPHQFRTQVRKEYNRRLSSKCTLFFY